MARVVRLPAPQAETAPLDSLSLAPGQPDRSQAVALDESKRQIATSIEASLTGRQRRTMEARAALLNYCNAMAAGGRTLLAVYEATAHEANSGLLPPELQALVPVANDRSGGQARLSARTLRRWASDRKKIGTAGVAPQKTRERDAAPAWMDEFLRYYARPMKPSIADAMRQWQEDHPEKGLPSYSAVRAALDKLSHHERARGREGRLALKARSAFTKRDTSDLMPASVYAADGTTWDREVEHPIHGRPFKPEITTIIDAHTRMCVGWSAGLPHYTDADYRAYLLREFKVDSSTRLTYAQANRVIETLATLAGQNGKPRRASERAEGPYAAKLRALWISAYHLGVARSRDDKALLAFVERQTGLSHTRFLKDSADAARAIEALKSWIAREANVQWPQRDSSVGYVDTKRAVATAAARIAFERAKAPDEASGLAWPEQYEQWAHKVLALPDRFAAYKPHHWDKFTAALGARIRARKARAKKKEAA